MRKRYEFKLRGIGSYEIMETEIKEPRSDGYYWVKYYGSWQIAEWHDKKWIFLGDIGLYIDEAFDMIHEEKIERPNY